MGFKVNCITSVHHLFKWHSVNQKLTHQTCWCSGSLKIGLYFHFVPVFSCSHEWNGWLSAQPDCTYRQRTYSQTSIHFCQQDKTVCKEILLQEYICILPEVFLCQSMHKYCSRLCPTVCALSVSFLLGFFIFFGSFSPLLLNTRVCRISGILRKKN